MNNDIEIETPAPTGPIDFAELQKTLEDANEIAIFCHINPDGDCIGALFALGRTLMARGKKVTMISHDGIPGFFKFVPMTSETVATSTNVASLKERNFDLAVMVDCATKKRAGEAFFPIMDASTLITIDHHATNDGFAARNFIDPSASSTCEILHRLFTRAGWNITPKVAECLYMGIMYDTGRFMHSNTTPEVFRICSELLAAGISPAEIANHVYRDRSRASLHILGYALVNMKTAADGQVAWATIPRSVFHEYGATDSDTEGIVETLGAYDGCEVHIVFTEGPDGRARVSTRSAGKVLVNEVCALFGGGGHKFASGIRSEKTLQEIEKLVVAEVVRRL